MSLANLHSWRRAVGARATAVAVLGLAFAGCGADNDSEDPAVPAVTQGTSGPADAKAPVAAAPEDEPASDPRADKDRIEQTLTLVLAGNDPSLVCDDLVTKRYLRRSFGDADGCAAAQAQIKTAKRVRIDKVVVLPDSVAQAVVRPSDGIYDGDTLRAELVLDAGTWKVDSLRSNVPVGP